jgi:hypothetical protein
MKPEPVGFFDAKPAKGKERERVVHGHLNEMFNLARAHRACLVGEDLDSFEGAKIGFSAANAMLQDIPYAQIRDAVVRKGLKMGVPVRFIHPAFTSLLGGIVHRSESRQSGRFGHGLEGFGAGNPTLGIILSKGFDPDLGPGGHPL